MILVYHNNGENYIGLFHSVFPAAAEIINSVLFQQTFDESINLFLVTLSYLSIYLSIYLSLLTHMILYRSVRYSIYAHIIQMHRHNYTYVSPSW